MAMNKSITITQKNAFSSERSIPDFFREIVKKNPNAPALIFEGRKMTYQELDKKSDILAQGLIKLGVKNEDFVAICLDRSFEMLIGIFGIIKAGGAYVPIDVDYPTERLEFLINDAQAKVILTQKNLEQRVPKTEAQLICLDADWWRFEDEFSSKKLSPLVIEPSQLAYMIYTSGSTGNPKGCMLTHENVMNQLEGQQAIAPSPIGCMILTCSISFDVSVLTIFWSLLQGARLLLPRQGDEKDMNQLSQLIEEEEVTHMLTLPSLYVLLLDQAEISKLASLKLVNVSGEVCPTSLAQKHEKLLPNTQLYNLYGPTEATVNCTYFTIPKGFTENKVPIGKPILNYEIFILNKEMKEVGLGEVGEIFIGGSKPVVGRGYWNRPELSEKRFIKNPFRGIRGGRTLYNTGDLARWMPDGNIEFLGRSDFQVKFRGFRIELGEIEVAIGNHLGVRETIVKLIGTDDLASQKLVAYVVPSSNFELTVNELREYLVSCLPEYMIPTTFVFLEKMPLTTNGKIDRKALPKPSLERPSLAQVYEGPQSDLEEFLTKIWSKFLDIHPIGRKDKFFELGGTSIQAARFVGELQKRMNTSIFITTIFDNPTIAEYAEMLESQYSKEIDSLLDRNVAKVSKPTTTKPENKSNLIEEKTESIWTPPPGKITSEHLQNFQKIIPKLIPSKRPNKKKNPKAVFILAPPRSGTTLLRVMLAGHPDLFAVNELQLLGFNDLKERNQAYQGKFTLWSEGLIRAIMELKGITAEQAKKLIAVYENQGWTTQQMFEEIQNWVAPKILVDKSPSYVLDYESLEKAERDFEDPIFIHLVRHPYSMVNSFEKYHMDQVLYLNEHNFSTRQLGELVWLESHKNTVQFLGKVPRHRHVRVIYEELVTQPAKVLWEICQTIGIPFHDNVLRPYSDLDKKMTDGIYQDSRSMGDINFDKQSKINAKKAEEWKGVRNDNFLCEETWSLTEYFGYESFEKGSLEELPLTPKGESRNNYLEEIKIQDSKEFNNLEIEEKVNKSNSPLGNSDNDIAIIGMSLRVAGANNIEEFWQNLINGIDVSKELNINEIKVNVNRTYTLDDPDKFDANFFGILPKEAEMMDPQHRVFLEVAYSALQNAGYNPKNYEGKIGVFGGVSRNAYFSDNIASHSDLRNSAGDYLDMMGSEKTFSISRVAYKLNLKGPAVNVQTACSSSGVAVHLACQSILNGDSDMVLVGGGRIQPPIDNGYTYKEGGPLSPDGYIRAFDANAQGMVQGHGMVMIVLKKLEKAVEDGDFIWSVIKGTAINNDGSDKIGFTAPSIKGQSEVIIKAQEKAGISADSISYIEAHGTGTLLGDPIEIAGLTSAFQRSTDKKQFCAIGSVKTNIGHLDAGACVAGIIKTSLALKHEKLPPSLNFEKPNPQIDFDNSPFFVNSKLREWKRNGQPRRAGVSSFGLGGTNAHVILEEAPITEDLTNIENLSNLKPATELLLFSGKTESATAKLLEYSHDSNTAFAVFFL
jgi:amino acid adenylation domain-containing protein